MWFAFVAHSKFLLDISGIEYNRELRSICKWKHAFKRTLWEKSGYLSEIRVQTEGGKKKKNRLCT